MLYLRESPLPDSLEAWLLFITYLPEFKDWALNHPAKATALDLEYWIPISDLPLVLL